MALVARRMNPLARAVMVAQRNLMCQAPLINCYGTTVNGITSCSRRRTTNYLNIASSSQVVVDEDYPVMMMVLVTSRRSFHSPTFLLKAKDSRSSSKPTSKVDQTVKVLEKELEVVEEKTRQGVVEPEKEKRPLMRRIKDEIMHYYHGFRLLMVDVKISCRLMLRIIRGKQLSRREYKQLIRTTSDLFRLLPFSVFIIVPFMELLLPLFVKLFPNMLPSTFESKQDRESKMKAGLKMKLEMAKFLQQTLDEMAPQASGRNSEEAKEFAEFIQKIQKSGAEATTSEILKYSKLFEDEITLDSLSRQQLIALCRVIEVPSLGTSTMLRFQLRLRLRNLIADDKVIEMEGIESLNLQELQNACKARGMRAIGMPEERLKRQLRQWLTLTLHEKVPASLLLLSRTMYLPETVPTTQQLQATLQALPDATKLQTKAAIGEREGKIDHKTRVELIKEEERKIQEERQEAKNQAKLREEEERAKMEELEEVDQTVEGPAEPGIFLDAAPFIHEPYTPDEADHSVTGTVNLVLYRKTPELPIIDDEITSQDFDEIENVIAKIGKDTKLVIEKEEIKDLKAEISDYVEDVQELEAITERAQKMKIKVKESKGARNLLKKLNNMVEKLDETVASAEEKDDKKTSVHHKNLLATEELLGAIRKAKDVKDPAKLARIAAVFAKLDDDKDGKIEVDDLVKVIDVIGKEHVDLSSTQLEELVKMLAKEELLEEERVKQLLEKK